MTSLAKQLQRLAVPHTQIVLGDDKKRASLLFDPREASNFDKETFHALGLNGIEELCNIEANFEEFEALLFGDASLTFERSIQTKEINEKLNLNIQNFLIHLSPYCLLKPAHKALEWLIHRFNIHLYNTDELILCFLPYHESKVFARVLQLIRFDSKIASKWDFLEPLQKNGLPLARTTLVNHCKTDLGFLSFVCDTIPKTVKVLAEKTSAPPKCRVLFSFYATTVIGVLDADGVREELLAMLLPHMSQGLKSKSLEYKASTYMILSQLLYKANLKVSLLKTLLHVLVKGMVPDLLEEGVACLLLMFQTQDLTALKLPKKTFKHMCRHHNLVAIVSDLSGQFDTDLFLSCFLDKLIPASFTHAVDLATSGSDSDSEARPVEYLSVLHRFLSNVKLSDDIAENAAYLFLEKYVRHGNKNVQPEYVDDRIKDSLQGIVRQLEGKHSDAVDKAVNKMISNCKTKHEQDLIQEFLNLYVLSVPHHLVTDAETSLVLSLNHRLPSVREKAIATLITNRRGVDDNAFLKESLSPRLKDDDPSVVLAALAIDKDIWSVMEDDLLVIDLLKKTVMKGLHSKNKKWVVAAKQATKISGTYSGEHQLELISSYLPCFFLLNQEKIEVGKAIVNTLLKSKLAAGNALLKAVAKEMQNDKQLFASKNLGDINHRLAKSIAKGLSENVDERSIETIASWASLAVGQQDMALVYLVIIVLDEMVAMATNMDMKLTLCLHQIQLIAKTKKTKGLQDGSCGMEDLKCTWGSLMSKTKMTVKHLSSTMCLKALHSIVQLVKVPAHLLKETFWQLGGDGGEDDLFLQVTVQLYDMLLEITMVTRNTNCVNTFRAIFQQLEKLCFSDSKTYVKFLGLLWTQHVNDHGHDLGLTLTLQARSLYLGLAYIKSVDKQTADFLLKSSSFFCSLLTVLTSEHTAVRMTAVQIAAELLGRDEECGSEFKPVLRKIVRCQEEIRSDASYIYQAIASVFKSTTLDETKSPRSARSKKSVGTSPGKGDKQQCLSQLIGQLVETSTPHFIQHSLLEVFVLLDNKDVLNRLLPLMSRLLKSYGQGGQPRLATQCLNLILHRFTVNTSSCLAPGKESLTLFISALKQSDETTGELMSPQKIALEQITKELYGELEGGSQQLVLTTLFDVYVGTSDLAVSNQIHKVLKHIALDGNHIHEELKQCLKQSTAKTVREAKRQRVGKAGDVDGGDVTEFDSKDWQRATIVLETVQNKKKIVNYSVLVPVCFELLASILNSDSHTSAEYVKQLVLALLYNICTRLEKNAEGTMEDGQSVPEEQFNMELIVNCIRSSDNPQTHHQALLLLTSAAKIFPEHLVHNIMSVFTFMGQSIMRQDDAYSFHIISKILETVIPALITACRQRKRSADDHEDIITMVIGVFVDSYPYIPNHRRHLLFHKLLLVIGGEKYLWRTLLLMMDMVVTKGTLKAELASEEADSSLLTSDMEFCLNLCTEFSPAVQFVSATEMITYLMKLPDVKDEDQPRIKKEQRSPSKSKKKEICLFDIGVHTDKQLRHFKYATIHLLVSLFSSTDLIAQISQQISETGYQELSPSFQLVLETLLKLVPHVARVTNRSNDKPTAKFWKAFLHKTHDLLDKFVTLLPDTLFIEVIGGLVASHDLPTIQRKALDLLNIKLQQQRQFTDSEAETLLPLVKQLDKLIHGHLLGREISEEGSVNGQSAFISLKLLCRNIGSSHTGHFIKVLKTTVEVFNKTRSTNIQVCSCALLCLAEVCNTLKMHIIQQLPTFMPALIKIMKEPDSLLQNELYLLSVVTTVNKVVENLVKFLSPYLLDLLTSVCVLSTRSSDTEVLQKPQVQIRLKAIRATLSSVVPTRVLLPTVMNCYKTLIKSGELKCISSLMSLFGDHISQISREDLTSQLTRLQTLFLQCLNLRIDHPELPVSILSEVEGVTIETIIDMVMKLSESTFKPFLFKLFDWATSSDDVRDRVLVFYRLAERLAERLRSLFTLFAGHIISHVSRMLESNNLAKNDEKFFPEDKKLRKKSCQLLLYVLGCLYKCCLYDTEGFITRERFETLMQPLVDQIENLQGGEERYTDRMGNHLVPCIVQMAVAAQDDSLWRSLNYQICLTTRSQEPQVKLSSLQVLDQLHKKLGEDYMPLLPDAVPFLAELMEDESEEVEKKCHEVIREMEKTLGEPLQKYF